MYQLILYVDFQDYHSLFEDFHTPDLSQYVFQLKTYYHSLHFHFPQVVLEFSHLKI